MRLNYRPLLLASTLLCVAGFSSTVLAQDTADKTVDKAKASYVVGWDMASQLPDLVRDELDAKKVAEAVQEQLSGKKMKMDEDEAKKVSTAFMQQIQEKAQAEFKKTADKNQQEGKDFLAKNKKAKGVKTTDSGLQYKVIKEGKGKHPGKDDTVQIDYVGTFLNGDEFDASKKHPEPADGTSMPLPVNGVIPGFREGLELMREGGHYKLWIPADLAYGSQPNNGFPPNATIVFDIHLEEIQPAEDAK